MSRIIYALALCFTIFTATAETIKLKDGRSFEGKLTVKEQTATIVTADDKLFQFNINDLETTNKEPAKEKPKMTNPVIRITTSKGDMEFELYEDKAPNTVANMIELAEKGFYKDMSFHRVIDNFMAQGGCPNSKPDGKGTPGTGGPGYNFADECSPSVRHIGRGILSMANAGRNTNGSQFFICFVDCTYLDGKHTVFGKIISGLDVLDKIEKVGSRSGATKEKVTFDIQVVSKQDHPYQVKKL